MRLRTKQAAVVAVLAAAGLATFAATGLGRQGDEGPQVEVTDPVEMKKVRTERLSANEAAARGLAVASKKVKISLQASYLVSTAPVAVPARSGRLVPLTCPSKTIPVSGGVLNEFVALVENNSSQSPPPGAPPADWYEGVTNTNTGGSALTFKPTLVCVQLKK